MRHFENIDQSVKPFLRWVGSKSRYSEFLATMVPAQYERYIEPFLGSGALFFYLRPKRAVLSDYNSDLIDVYNAVRDHPGEIVNILMEISVDRETYYNIRENRSSDKNRWAAEFIYLNRLCWNGLYRVNLSGKFNVPYGRQKYGHRIDVSLISACSRALRSQDICLVSSDFEEICEKAVKGDFVFIDPPYVTSHNNNGFVEYNEKIFSWSDQVRLSEMCKKMHSRGVKFLLTNANHENVTALYDDFVQRTFSRQSTLAGDKNYRKPTSELVVTNFGTK